MKKITFTLIALLNLICLNIIKADDNAVNVELYITNRQITPLYVRFYPISAVFSGNSQYIVNSPFRLLSINPGCERKGGGPFLFYLVGLDGYALSNRGPEGYFELTQYDPQLDAPILHLDITGSNKADGLFGYGIYNLEIRYYNVSNESFDLITPEPIVIDCHDLNYPHPDTGSKGDLLIDINSRSPLDIKHHWERTYQTTPISIYDTRMEEKDRGNLKYWKQYKLWTNFLQIFEAIPNQNPYRYGETDNTSSYNLLFPIDGTNSNVVPPPYTIPQHINPGLLVSNLHIKSDHQPRILCNKLFEVTNNVTLKLIGGSNTKLIVGDGNSNCNATLKFDCGSKLYIESGAEVFIRTGSKLCDEGAIKSGPGRIKFEGGIRRIGPCAPCQPTGVFKDRIKTVLDPGVVLELPDSTFWIFEGVETALLCDSGSTIKFGKASKLVFTDGARINAKHTKFSTYDSNTTWNGIYLSGLSYDTLQYCTIENALNGINIEDKTSLWQVPATEISNCAFSNKTSEQLLNMVYVNNSANVMIRNCSSSSLIGDGFASGVIIEYCTAGGVNVIDNEIGYVTTGMNVIQSSPYIARNTVTGAGTSGTGIFLDNSNGTIEYNIVSSFNKSAVLYYSSPFMLKNTFSDANAVCADVTAYSVPVMKPVASGSTLRWLGGNNYFTGSPSDAGITLESEGHPLMDSGYNVVSVGNSLYMQGTISRVLYMRVNNWYDDPPQTEKFDISGEEYDYSEYFDGYTIPPTDYYELNSIGFGYYDTVYVDEIGGDNPTAEDIFILGYRKEMERKFVEAVVLYKNVISAFKTSNYAITSLSRIFNCLEKSNAGITQYSAVKSYYDQIKNSNTYPQRIREHAEDLAIKAKVRMGYIEEAISDYQTTINNNLNNPKGIHAQVNKLVLTNMNSGGDNIMIRNNQTKENYKANLLSLITGKHIQTENKFANNIPRQFKLHQNYPNPFNPKTSIKYEIPVGTRHGVLVKLTIFDITGREIVNIIEINNAGSYSYTFDGTNFASGLYLYKIHVRQAGSSTGSFVETKKMVLMK